MNEKYERLKEYMKSLGSAAVAFSSGVDSTFLLKAAKAALGDNVIAVTAKSRSFPKRELNEAVNFCKENNIRHIIFESEELGIDGFRQNPVNRCYLCKKEIFKKIKEIADANNIACVSEGSNTDDDGDYRPGLIAVKELGIKSPLRHVGFTKREIRELSKRLGLPTWNKQSFACLATRFVYGEEITEKKLDMVDRSEQLLLDMGFHQLRVRIHGNIARIEVMPDEFEKLIKNRENIYTRLKSLGFDYVTMDLQGYRTGSMNETVTV